MHRGIYGRSSLKLGRKNQYGSSCPKKASTSPEADANTLRDVLGAGAVVNIPGTDHSIHRDDLGTFLTTIQQWIAEART